MMFIRPFYRYKCQSDTDCSKILPFIYSSYLRFTISLFSEPLNSLPIFPAQLSNKPSSEGLSKGFLSFNPYGIIIKQVRQYDTCDNMTHVTICHIPNFTDLAYISSQQAYERL